MAQDQEQIKWPVYGYGTGAAHGTNVLCYPLSWWYQLGLDYSSCILIEITKS
jgi:hypothetical protein